tara:strand:+ start:32328 stop:33371 length:1044 start_codon:yes stop_codon:yes gene_type:complete
MIAAAGTGGHIYPGLSIAEYFYKNKYKISWVGTHHGMENKLVDKSLYNFYAIKMRGVRGKGLLSWLGLPFKLLYAIIESLFFIHKVGPKYLILMGGYVCFPIAIAGKLMGVKIFIHEQNAIPGLSNKLLAFIANKIFLGFKNNLRNSTVIGNPIRESLYKVTNPFERFKERKGPLRILIFGGSLGAKKFNELLPAILSKVAKKKELLITHQSGEFYYNFLLKEYKKYQIKANPIKYIHDMKKNYAWADIVISRSGALTVSELREVGVASILIPFPYAVDNHQYFNAKVLSQKDGAKIIMENRIEDELEKYILSLNREKCMTMAQNAKVRNRQEASKKIYEYLSNYEK